MECMVCYDGAKSVDEMYPDTCCMRNICRSCYRKWFSVVSGRNQAYAQPLCMICRNPLEGLANYWEQYRFTMDFSTWKDAASSFWILFNSTPCMRCGARLTHIDGCQIVTCGQCHLRQRFGEVTEDKVSIIVGDGLVGRLFKKFISPPVKFAYRVLTSCKQLTLQWLIMMLFVPLVALLLFTISVWVLTIILAFVITFVPVVLIVLCFELVVKLARMT